MVFIRYFLKVLVLLACVRGLFFQLDCKLLGVGTIPYFTDTSKRLLLLETWGESHKNLNLDQEEKELKFSKSDNAC